MSPDEIIASLRAINRGCRAPTGHARGSRNGRAVLLEEEIVQIKRLAKMGVRPKVIMAQFPKLNYRNYWHIVSNKIWKHIQ